MQDAACQLYGRVGWAGFSIDAVAREARVGKSSIYLRRDNNTALLLDSLQARIDVPYEVDTGSVQGDLLVLARSIFALLTGDAGDARWEEFMAANVAAMRAITRRAIRRNVLPPKTPVTLLLDALFGGLLMQCLPHPRPRCRRWPSKPTATQRGWSILCWRR